MSGSIHNPYQIRRLPLLTTSAARAYRTCPRWYYYSYEQLYRPCHEAPTLKFGTLGHRGLEVWWTARAEQPWDADAWLDAALLALDEHPYTDPYDLARARALMLGYHARWASVALSAIAVEVQYETSLINPATGAASRTWEHGGKIDVVVRAANGELYLLDHKYTSEDWGPGSDYRQRLLMDAQISNYAVGARSLGFEVRGWIHDVIKRPAQRPLKAVAEVRMTKEKRAKDGTLKEESRPYAGQRLADETPDEYFERIAADIAERPNEYFGHIGPVVRTADDETEAAFDLWQTGVQIRESRNATMWPRNVASCKQYGRSCAFLPVCSGQASLDDPTRYRRAAVAHEELDMENSRSEKTEGAAA